MLRVSRKYIQLIFLISNFILLAVKKLENSLLKLYLITAYNHNKTEKISEFFTKLACELQQQSEWKDWFCKYIFFIFKEHYV